VNVRCQQDEVYAAERAVPPGRTFTDLADAQAFVDCLRETWWWERFFWAGPARVEVYFRRHGMSVNDYDRTRDAGLIELVAGQRDVKTLLHELAHNLANALHDSHAHDPHFARTYGVLVYAVMGSDAWLTLQGGYDACGVEYLQNTKEE
jgi:putative metallohydrolase (TIGR04338 family)